MRSYTLFFVSLAAVSGPAWVAGQERPAEPVGTIERRDPRFDKLVPKDSAFEKLADGFTWAEGPVWDRAGGYLLFSDIPNNIVMKWKEGEGMSQFLKPSGYTGTVPRGGDRAPTG